MVFVRLAGGVLERANANVHERLLQSICGAFLADTIRFIRRIVR